MKLYILPISEAALIPEDYCISHFPARLERSKKFRKEDDRLRCIGAGALLSAVLHADEKDILTGPHGKPYLAGSSIFFNISHSGNYIVMAADSTETGTDIELIKEPIESVAGRVYTAEERRWMDGDGEKFYILWTLKESVMKALGRGLSLDPAAFTVMPAIGGRPVSAEGNTLYCSYSVFDGHAFSACSFRRSDGIELNRISCNDIIKL